MARPAGLSDDEWDSDDEISFSDNFFRSKVSTPDENKVVIIKEEKLISAVLSRDVDEAKALIENGAEVNYKPDKKGWSSLMHACALGHCKLIELLLNHGADPNIHVELTTPVMCLCSSTSNFEEAQLVYSLDLLVKAGANVNAYNVHRETALMFAAENGHYILVKRLLEYGAELDFISCDGWSAIFYAVNKGYPDMVQLLKDLGANINLTDFKGQTLYDIAEQKNHSDVVPIIAPDNLDVVDELYIQNHSKNISDFQFISSELPNYNKSDFDGFYEDVIKTIAGVNMRNALPLFMEKRIGYGKFLINMDEDWKKLGVRLSFDRKKLITYAYNIIKKNWSTNALIDHKGDDFTLFKIAQKLSNKTRVIHILVATCYICNREIITKQHLNEDRKKLKELLNIVLHEIKVLRNTINRMDKILENIEESNIKYSADYIGPNSYKDTLNLSAFNRCRSRLYLMITLFGLSYLFRKSVLNFKEFLITSFYRLIS